MSPTSGKVIKCKAAVAWEPNKPMVIEEIEVDPPKAKEIRIKVVATGMCHSDLSAWKGIIPFAKFPTVLGHEAGGVVESVGSDITSVQEGDHVLSSFLPMCHSCPLCKSPNTNLCLNVLQPPGGLGFFTDGTTRMSCNGKPLHAFLGCSTFAEYTVMEEGSFTKVKKEAPLDKICILSCGVTTGYGSAVKYAKVKPGSICAVFGLGTVGLAAVMGCRLNGAKRIIGVDINNDKKEIAKTFGVTDFYNPKEHDQSIEKVLMETTQGGCDYTFECIGNTEVIVSAFNSCKIGSGQCILIGVPPAGAKIEVDPYQIIFGRELKGCFLGGYVNTDVADLVDDYMNNKIMLDEFITSTLKIDDIMKSFDLMIEGKTVKTVLSF